MRRHRKAKVVATLGPASSTKEMILSLFEAGVDMFRFNFSHGTQEDHRARHEAVREVERKRRDDHEADDDKRYDVHTVFDSSSVLLPRFAKTGRNANLVKSIPFENRLCKV